MVCVEVVMLRVTNAFHASASNTLLVGMTHSLCDKDGHLLGATEVAYG